MPDFYVIKGLPDDAHNFAALRKKKYWLGFSFALILVLAHCPILSAQPGVIESKVSAELKLSKVGEVLGIHAEIIDGFSYRFPFSISTDSDQIDLNSLTAESICNCVQVRFDKGVLSKNTATSGEIFLRPKSGQLVEGVKIRGFRSDGADPKTGEGDNVALILALKIKVVSPIELSERHLMGIIEFITVA